jgi:ABC-type multidrug transport system ATPase subunit
VAILNEGQLLRTGTVQELTKAIKGAPLQLQLFGDRPSIEQVLAGWPAATLREAAPGACEIEVPITEQQDADRLIDALRARGVSIFRMARRERTLEEVFMTIVGEASR